MHNDYMRLAGIAALLIVARLWGADQTFRLNGRIEPPSRAAISLHGSTKPFSASALSEANGRFEFKNLLPGDYTVAVFIPNRGELRRTIEVGPGSADSKGAVAITVRVEDSLLVREPARRAHMVSAGELAIPDKARKAYEDAQKKLEKRDVTAAVEKLEEAVKLAPNFVAAWNNLGTIFYQTRQYSRAEGAFRSALEQDPESYEPLVNLGGVLLTLKRPDEAMHFNLYSVLSRPEDALANSQLGMNYFALGRLELARKYLSEAKRIDPAHFSHPQLLLAEICFRTGDRAGAARELQDFLERHPDSPDRDRLREAIEKLR